MTTTVWLGQDLLTKEDVREPMGHGAVFGQTRRAGKTTTLRTILQRLEEESDAEYLVFRTGTGEIAFPGAYPSTPFFRARLDWQAVESMLWTFLSEKPKVYRPIIMRAVRGARSLEDVHRNMVDAGKKSKNGWVVDRTYELDTYFQEILPWLKEHELATMVYLRGSGGNVVDLEGWPRTVQQLVVAATLDALMAAGKRSHPLVVVLPEAREFIPDGSATPVTRAADRLARMGAKLNLFLWIDSQALTGVDQQTLRNFALVLQGVQTHDLEINRVSKVLEVKPKAVRDLRVGDFLLHTQDGVRTIHVPLVEPKEDPNVDAAKEREYREAIDRLTTEKKEANRLLQEQAKQLRDLEKRVVQAETLAKHAADLDGVPTSLTHGAVKATHEAVSRARVGVGIDPLPPVRVAGDSGAFSPLPPSETVDLEVQRTVHEITVHKACVRIEANDETHEGKLAILALDGFFDEKQSTGPIAKEYEARGWGKPTGGNSAIALRTALKVVCGWGLLRRMGGFYSVVPDAKARIKTIKVPTTLAKKLDRLKESVWEPRYGVIERLMKANSGAKP